MFCCGFCLIVRNGLCDLSLFQNARPVRFDPVVNYLMIDILTRLRFFPFLGFPLKTDRQILV